MKNQKGSRIGNVFRRVINVRAWIDHDRNISSLNYLTRGFKRLFVPQKRQDAQPFDAVMQAMQLDDRDLFFRQRALRRLSIFMLFLAGLLFTYSGYHLILGNFRATVLSLIVTCLALVLAFRYHFWSFLIKKRKLGCSFNEWFREGLMGEKE